MYYAIVTRFHKPTNSYPPRISASTDRYRRYTVWDASLSGDGYRRYTAWDYSLSSEDNYRAAAEALAVELGWLTPDRTIKGGALPDERDYHWVFVPRNQRVMGYAWVFVPQGDAA